MTLIHTFVNVKILSNYSNTMCEMILDLHKMTLPKAYSRSKQSQKVIHGIRFTSFVVIQFAGNNK
jgi:hypothetical protein